MICAAISVNQIATIALPEFKNQGRFVKFSDNEAYLRSFYDGYSERVSDRLKELKTLDAQELTKERTKEHKNTILKMRSDARELLFESCLCFLVCLIFFALHWVMNKRLEKNKII